MATSCLHEINLLQEIFSIFKSKTLYMLGAGTSAKYISPKRDLYDGVKKMLMNECIFPTIEEKKLTNEQKERYVILGGDPQHIIHKTLESELLKDETEMDFYNEIIYSYPELLEAICALAYSLDLKQYPTKCPEYEIFNLSNSSSKIINLNHDDLAEHFVKKINLIPLHGTITSQQKNIIHQYLPYILNFPDAAKELLKNLYLSTKENEHLLITTKEYKSFMRHLKEEFRYIVIIGYSFFKKNDCDIYDVVTYDLIRSYLREHVSQVVIIDPNPYFVADILAKGINTLNVKCYEIYWNSFTYAFFSFMELKHFYLDKIDVFDQRRFIEFYHYFLNNDFHSFEKNYSRIFSKKSYRIT